ncbi:MAG: hypothetical protein L3J54_08580 [Draconibacterium sp.]|nr:hypothetical protein [Draconibacterium sp.]
MQEDNVNDGIDSTNRYLKKQITVSQELEDLIHQEEIELVKRKQVPYKIKIDDMPENVKYNKLNLESKRFQNIIKMICFRAETSFANLLSKYYNKSINEKRAIVKSIINSHADIIPDYQNNKLIVRLYSQQARE